MLRARTLFVPLRWPHRRTESGASNCPDVRETSRDAMQLGNEDRERRHTVGFVSPAAQNRTFGEFHSGVCEATYLVGLCTCSRDPLRTLGNSASASRAILKEQKGMYESRKQDRAAITTGLLLAPATRLKPI